MTADHELKHAQKIAKEDGLQEGLEKGQEAATRDAIVTTARAFGVEVTPAREAALQALDLAGLKAFFQALLQQRAWPSSAP